MSKSIQLKNKDNEKMYPHPYYPVGSIYLSVNNTNPTKWFGGTWELIAQGRTLVGVDTSQTEFNTVKKTGGEKTHKLTVNELPSHRHRTAIDFGGNESLDNYTSYGYNSTSRYYNLTSSEGGDQAHNNLQPYFTCYIWCRTA